MNLSGLETLTNPQPCGHIVYSYTNESELAEAVFIFARAGLRKGEAVLLTMTADHYKPVKVLLEDDGFDTQQLEATGQLVWRGAKILLQKIMIDAKSSGGKRRSVRVFGEMVDLIWTSRPATTQRLEELWNQVIAEHSVPLLCAYSLGGSRPPKLTESLLACHSHALA